MATNKSRMEVYAIARQNGWMSANDIRELENLNPLPEEEGGNAYLMNLRKKLRLLLRTFFSSLRIAIQNWLEDVDFALA